MRKVELPAVTQATLHTKFQASEPNGPEVEDFLKKNSVYFYGSNLRPPWPGACLDPVTFV